MASGPLSQQASEALDAAHKACLAHPGRDVIGMSNGPFSGVNLALGIIARLEVLSIKNAKRIEALEAENAELKQIVKRYV